MKTQQPSKKELDEIYNKISDEKRNEATLIYNELSFIIDTIEKLKEEIRTKGATEHFINGKQDFIRESPALSSYTRLMKTYDIFYKNLINLLDDNNANNKQDNVLSLDDFSFHYFNHLCELEYKKGVFDLDTDDPKRIKVVKDEYKIYLKDPNKYEQEHEKDL